MSLDSIHRLSLEPKISFKLRLEASITYNVSQSVFPIYLSLFSSEWTEIWHDDSQDGMVTHMAVAFVHMRLFWFWLIYTWIDGLEPKLKRSVRQKNG